jgi:hypothetical protein
LISPIRGFGLLVTALALSGCAIESACRPGPYQEAGAASPLDIPEDLDAPEQRAAMRVPDAGAAPGRPVEDDRCVIEPPRFYAEAGEANPDGLPLRPGSLAERGEPIPAAPATVLTREVIAFLEDWAGAWSRRDADAWLGFYVADYAPAGYADAAEWRADQRRRFETPAVTKVDPDTVRVEAMEDGRTRARFVQHFGELPDLRTVLKEIVLAPRSPGTRWRIVEEQIVDVM